MSGKIYCNKGGRWTYSAALTVVWMLTMVSFAGDWVTARAAVDSNNSPALAIVSNLDIPIPVLGFVSGILANGFSDAIIVRVFIVA